MSGFEIGDIEGATFHIINQGCKVNRVEADTVAVRFRQLGAVLSSEDEAELVVVNTCTVTGEADKKARKAVRRALRHSPGARVLVTGCAVAIDEEAYRGLGQRVEVVQRGELLALLDDAIAKRRALTQAQAGQAVLSFPTASVRFGEGFRTRVSVKVQDGCDRACTYCIVHVARGPARSAPFEDVLREADAHLGSGVKELVLAGIDLGSYQDGGRGLADLVSTLLELADKHACAGELPARIRSSSLEPITLDERFIELIASSDGRVCRHLHLPLQSGSSKVLREMGRPYTAEWFGEQVARLRERIPSLSLTTDVICGFPGEDDGDFAETMALVQACRFSKVHVFPYSRRAGTPAAARWDQVDERVKAERAAQLRRLSDELRARDLASRRATIELALVEEKTALSESYHEVRRPADARTGDLVPIVL